MSHKLLRPQYSGKGSEHFWHRVNTLTGREDWIAAYNLGCALQDLEARVLNFINRPREPELPPEKARKPL